MVKWLPGWLNFIFLFVFYSFTLYGLSLFIKFMMKLYAMLLAEFGQFALVVAIILLAVFPLFYAGGYLAKWREEKGGGWSFNRFGKLFEAIRKLFRRK